MRTRLPRPARLAATCTAATLAATLLLATPAWAHVTVHPASVPAGASDIELTFRVPNERDHANTVGVEVFFPENLPLLTVDVLPVPGWTAKVGTRTLATPIKTDDGPVTEVVTDVTWTATGAGLAAGQYQDFDIAAGQAPGTSGDVVFKTLQTYSSGEVVRWIQVPTTDDPNPDSPAPVLTVTPAGSASTTAVTASSSSPDGVAIAALVVGGLALVGVVVLLVSTRRRPATGHRDGAAGGPPVDPEG